MPNPNPNQESFEDQLNRISGDIDQVTVQNIFKKLSNGSKKHDDALWALTSEAAREIRRLVKGDLLAAHKKEVKALQWLVQQQKKERDRISATTDQRVAEALLEGRRQMLNCYPSLDGDWKKYRGDGTYWEFALKWFERPGFKLATLTQKEGNNGR